MAAIIPPMPYRVTEYSYLNQIERLNTCPTMGDAVILARQWHDQYGNTVVIQNAITDKVVSRLFLAR